MVTPGLHRRPHPHGRAGLLGPARHLLVLARRHHGGDGQLRLHARPGATPTRATWWCATSSGPRTSRRRHGRRHRLGRGRPSPSTSTRSTGCPRASTTPRNIGHSALRTWAMGERAFERGGDRRRPRADGARAARRDAGRRDRASRRRASTSTRRPTTGRSRPGSRHGTRSCRLVGVLSEPRHRRLRDRPRVQPRHGPRRTRRGAATRCATSPSTSERAHDVRRGLPAAGWSRCWRSSTPRPPPAGACSDRPTAAASRSCSRS